MEQPSLDKNHKAFLLLPVAGFFVFLFELIVFKQSFLHGDYWQQFYPWAFVLHQSLHKGLIPFWVSGMQCGFPLAAEGQVGAFHPFNLLFNFLLPFPLGYHYEIVFSFLLAGVFSYRFARGIGYGRGGASLASFLLMFGSAYAGCHINTVSLRTLAWFPLALYSLDRFTVKGQWKYIALFGMAGGMMFLGGYLQMAVYACVMLGLYAIYRLFLCGPLSAGKERKWVWIVLGFFVAILLSSFQLLSTKELSAFSVRKAATLDFALSVGSFSPLMLVSPFFPDHAGLLGFKFYLGIASLFLILIALFAKQDIHSRFFILLCVVALFFALGRFNPVYVFFIKTFKLFFLRNHFKWIYFLEFAMAYLAGRGLDLLLEKGRDLKAEKFFISMSFLVTVAVGLVHFLIGYFKTFLVSFGKDYVMNQVYGRGGRYQSLDYYWQRVEDFYNRIFEKTSLTNPDFLKSLCLILSVCGLIWILRKGRLSLKKFVVLLLLILAVDLYGYREPGTGFKGNWLAPGKSPAASSEAAYLKETDQSLYRIYTYIPDGRHLYSPLIPNGSLTHQIDQIGIYTPLALYSHSNLLTPLGAVDDSLGFRPVDVQKLYGNLDLLGRLNVKYLISPIELADSHLRKIKGFGKSTIYQNGSWKPRAYFVKKDLTVDGEAGFVDIQFWLNGDIRLTTTKDKPGLLFLSESAYPGWKATLDGLPLTSAENKEEFLLYSIPAGKHELSLSYHPPYLKSGWILTGLGCLLLVVLVIPWKTQNATV